MKELKKFLKFMFFACSYCERFNIEIGPIHPDYIFLTEQGLYRLSRKSEI